MLRSSLASDVLLEIKTTEILADSFAWGYSYKYNRKPHFTEVTASGVLKTYTFVINPNGGGRNGKKHRRCIEQVEKNTVYLKSTRKGS